MKQLLLVATCLVFILILSESSISKSSAFLRGKCKNKRWRGCVKEDESYQRLKRRFNKNLRKWSISNFHFRIPEICWDDSPSALSGITHSHLLRLPDAFELFIRFLTIELCIYVLTTPSSSTLIIYGLLPDSYFHAEFKGICTLPSSCWIGLQCVAFGIKPRWQDSRLRDQFFLRHSSWYSIWLELLNFSKVLNLFTSPLNIHT